MNLFPGGQTMNIVFSKDSVNEKNVLLHVQLFVLRLFSHVGCCCASTYRSVLWHAVEIRSFILLLLN